MAPIVNAMRALPERFAVRVLFSAQHRSLLDGVAAFFEIHPDRDLDLMRADQRPSSIATEVTREVERDLAEHTADLVLAQGDTATVFGAALGAFHARVPFAHVEAGLRTGDLLSPFPEEGYRRLVTSITTLHFAPTEVAMHALLREGVPTSFVHMTGNTVIDALLHTVSLRRACPITIEEGQRLVLVTLHRRESFGAPLERIVDGLQRLLEEDPSAVIALPMHPNPSVRKTVMRLAGHPRVRLLEALDYPDFVALLAKAALVITDSGGVQEEAPALGIPVLVARESTERPEGVAAGCAELIGSDAGLLVRRAIALLHGPRHHRPMSPYGDGLATPRILAAIQNHFAAKHAEAELACSA
jgi:UDP-N-acetylglucosamine 2-epimerase (non-hydrolysing)